MRKVVLVLFWLACIGHGQLLEASSWETPSSAFRVESGQPLKSFIEVLNVISNRATLEANAESRPSPSKSLAEFLLAFCPSAALRSTGLGTLARTDHLRCPRSLSVCLNSQDSLELDGALPYADMKGTPLNADEMPDGQVLSPGMAIKGLYAAFNARSLAGVGSFLTDDCVYEDLLFGPATICRGKKAFMNALQFHPAFVSSSVFSKLPFADALPDLTLEVDSIAEGKDVVGVEWHVQCGQYAFPLGRGLSQAEICPETGKIKRVVDIAEAPWRVVGLIALPFINAFQVLSKMRSQGTSTAPEDPMQVAQGLEADDQARDEAALFKGREELDSDIKVQREVLEAAVSSLGPEHPATLWSKNNLASTLKARGELKVAEELQREVLEARMSIFGSEHPDTLWTKHNLANTLSARGDLQSAEKLQREVLEARIHTLGPEHPATLTIKNNLDLTLEEFESAQKEYASADTDGSGELDAKEFKALAQRLGITDDSEADKLFQDVDTDGSGSVDLKEFTFWFSTSFRSKSNSKFASTRSQWRSGARGEVYGG